MLKTVEALREALITFTQEIIRIPSLTGQEGDLATVILNKLQEIGVDDAFIDKAGNVVGLLWGTGEGPIIMLNSHLDVVPAGDLESWHGYGPFGAEIDPEGNIRGRGASDLKGGLSVQLYALKLLKSLRDQGLSLNGSVIFSSVVHEEAAEMLGMEVLLKETLPERNLNCDLVFLCEPSSLRVILGHRGKVEIVVTTKGKSVHSSTPSLGINALQKMLPVLDTIFNEMGQNLPTHPVLGESSITVTNLVCRPGALSIIPNACEISVDRRYMPEETLEDILTEFEQLFAVLKRKDPEFEATVRTRKFVERTYTGYEREVQKYHPPWIIDQEHPFVQPTLKALQRVGHDPEVGYWKFGTDGSMSAGLLGIPTIGYSGMEECYAHTSEDQVNIEKMMQSLEGYYAILGELLGIDVLALAERTKG